MKFFGLIIISTYSTILMNFAIFHKAEWRTLPNRNFSVLKTKDTWLNKILLLMLDKYKYISVTKKERIYFYYTKKICKFMMLLATLWFILIYLMRWYENNIFLKWNFCLSFVLCLLPTFILNLMIATYDIKKALHDRKRKKWELRGQFYVSGQIIKNN